MKLPPVDSRDVNGSPGWMLASLLVGTVGTGLFLYGKKQARFPQLLVGGGLMVYPYFVASPALMIAIGVALVAGLWCATRAGM